MTGHDNFSMGSDSIRYLVFINGRWRWRPSKAMRAAGFQIVTLGRGTRVDGRPEPTLEEKRRALQLNEDWDRHRRGLGPAAAPAPYPPGSIGAAFLRAMELRAQDRQAQGKTWTTEQRSRDDWPRAWKWIGPLFGDWDPRSVTPEHVMGYPEPNVPGLRPLVVLKVSETEAHRVIKVWRALWQRMAAFGLCDKEMDPSFQLTNRAPKPRQALWREGEAVRLVKAAWRHGYSGLAACLAVAWDSQLSPVDVRRLRHCDYRRDAVGAWFQVDRAKTGRAATATLSRRTERLLAAYAARLGIVPVKTAPIFRNRSGAPYSKDTLGDDFRDIRDLVFGSNEKRYMSDFRRSGTVEAFAGAADPQQVSAKMANTLAQSNQLHETYSPVQLVNVREADQARRRGRRRLRDNLAANEATLSEQNETKSVTAPDRKCHNDVQ